MFASLLPRAPGVLLTALCAVGLCLSPTRCVGQGEAGSNSAISVLHAGTRLVVEDVLVMDAKGEPVHGLPKSAFHVFDEDKPQKVRNFEEGSPAVSSAEAPPSLPPGTFSNNSYLYSSALVSDVFLIDADDIQIEDQMFLLQQLRRSIDSLPPGVQAAVFCEASGHTVQIRGFTAQHASLESGIAECIPRIHNMAQNTFASGINQLLKVAATLQPLPGRKSILWFSGRFPLVPTTDEERGNGSIPADYIARLEAFHQMQSLLAEARISVFPLDPRGVLVSPLIDEYGLSLPVEEYDYMRQLAKATGGTTSHLNSLEQQIDRAVSLEQNSYTLSYSPAGYANDNSWHTIRVAVDGPYRISYRRGYLASWTGPASGTSNAGSGRLLATGVKAHSMSLAAPLADRPLLFTVQVDQPATTPSAATSSARLPVHGNDRVDLLVRIPVQQLGFTHDGGQWQSSASVVAYAYDGFGKLRGGERQELDSSLDEEQWQAAQTAQVGTHESFAIPRSAKYVLFVVTDSASRRQGTLMIPVRALRPNS